MSLRLHPEHGVNPSVEICFWCGNSMGVLLLGYNRNREAPSQMCAGYDPCDTCKKNMARGVACVELTSAHHEELQITPGFKPTGRWSVITMEAAERAFGGHPDFDRIRRHRKAFMLPDTYTALFGENPPEVPAPTEH